MFVAWIVICLFVTAVSGIAEDIIEDQESPLQILIVSLFHRYCNASSDS